MRVSPGDADELDVAAVEAPLDLRRPRLLCIGLQTVLLDETLRRRHPGIA